MVQFHTGWLGLAVGLLAAQAMAKDLQLMLWDTPECKRLSKDSRSQLLSIPRNNDTDPNASISCTYQQNYNFNGWPKDPHNQQTVAYVNTRALSEGCQLIFYNRGPTPDMKPEQVFQTTCWQPYRKVSKLSSCARVTFDPAFFSLAVCCGEACYVPKKSSETTPPVFPEPPPVPPPPFRRSELLSLPQAANVARNDDAGVISVRQVQPRSKSSSESQRMPVRVKTKSRDLIRRRRNNNNVKRQIDAVDLSQCQFSRTGDFQTTYLDEVMVGTPLTCGAGTGAEACEWEISYSADVQMTASQGVSVSASLQIGLEGFFSVSTTFGWEGSSAIAQGQSVSSSFTMTLAPGRTGYPAFKQLFRCFSGNWSGCDIPELTRLSNEHYCLPVMTPLVNNGGNVVGRADGSWVTVDTS
ncbi:hypothetical protein B0T16DRAFT_407931 [Cercophora newfieldiana]|uniref:Uncharacterized protein n=1 Tax=Cercophora newfieldiana TaxID=92897 RepID=A0AA39YAA0_9PEZI|nr:hypothetical protein B0T16DRAFT_407931 [Cercophora newfieldiana]